MFMNIFREGIPARGRWVKNWFHDKKRRKRILVSGVMVMVVIWLVLCASMRLTVREPSFAEEDCMLYYIVNADGMKGLGHSILLLVNEQGMGTVFSFNGMQRSLGESLLGKSGIGKMCTGTMTAEETKSFLQTGNLNIEGDQLTDNYDMALYRPITTEAYQAILEQTAPYFAAEQQFGILYEKWALEEDAGRKAQYKQALEKMAQDTSLPLYQIYTNNCDHAVRTLISPVDLDMQEYSRHTRRMTPNGNLKAFGAKAKNWGVMELGGQTVYEKVLMFFMIF